MQQLRKMKMSSVLKLILTSFIFTSSDGFQPHSTFVAASTAVANRSYHDKYDALVRSLGKKSVGNSEGESRQIAVEIDFFVEHHASDINKTKQADVVPKQSKLPRRKSIQIYGDISNIDPLTVTALLFAALAVNYILFAHWEDSGLSKLIARVINTVS